MSESAIDRAAEGPKAGEMHPVDGAFYRLTVAQRNAAWAEIERMKPMLRSDAEQAVLDAAEAWLDGMDEHGAIGLAGWEARLRTAVRARREAQP